MSGNEEKLDRIAAAAMAGEAPALSSLMARSWDLAFRLAARMLGDRHAAQDVAQTACERVLRSLRFLRSAKAYSTWFYSIVTRIALRERMTLARRASIELCDRPAIVDPTDSVAINEAIDRLKSELKDVVVLFYGCDLSTDVIARSLNVPNGTVRYRLHEARKQLREMLESSIDKESVGL